MEAKRQVRQHCHLADKLHGNCWPHTHVKYLLDKQKPPLELHACATGCISKFVGLDVVLLVLYACVKRNCDADIQR